MGPRGQLLRSWVFTSFVFKAASFVSATSLHTVPRSGTHRFGEILTLAYSLSIGMLGFV